jgi:hypothetical protein
VRRSFVVSSVVIVSLVGLAFAVAPRPKSGRTIVREAHSVTDEKGERPGLSFRLSEGAEEQAPYVRPPIARGESLSDDEVAALLARLSALKMVDED